MTNNGIFSMVLFLYIDNISLQEFFQHSHNPKVLIPFNYSVMHYPLSPCPRAHVSPKFFLAEGKGFEPPVPCGTSDFESDAIDHSATPPFQDN